MVPAMIKANIVEQGSDRAVADWLETRLSVAFAAKGPVHVAMPGGSTPFPILEMLIRRDLDFSRLVVVPTDDRDVPEDHDASNTGKLRALFEPVGARVVSLDESEPDDFDTIHFALVWLGMGADGHIASLFPNTDPQANDAQRLRRITPDPLPPEAPFDRLTLTLPTLLDTRELMLVVRGLEKRAVLDAALKGETDLPIARLLRANAARQNSCPVTCFT